MRHRLLPEGQDDDPEEEDDGPGQEQAESERLEGGHG
jgi:hypothetical protein